MNYCTKCASFYQQPGTCNCYATQPELVPSPHTYPYPLTPQPYTPTIPDTNTPYFPITPTITWCSA